MGTDIHLFAERKTAIGWEAVPVVYACTECEHYTDACYECKGTGFRRGYNERNYDLFAILAGVRNGYGFAGTKTGDAVVPISEPRGIPSDASDIVRRVNDMDDTDAVSADHGAGWLGDHSFSWLATRELVEHNWDQQKGHVGMVPLSAWLKWKASGHAFPTTWCSAVSGPRVRKISEEVATKITAADKEAEDIYVCASWTTSQRDACRDFLDNFLPALVAIPGETRVVFGFDS
jgi:hypothetical protein